MVPVEEMNVWYPDALGWDNDRAQAAVVARLPVEVGVLPELEEQSPIVIPAKRPRRRASSKTYHLHSDVESHCLMVLDLDETSR